MTINWKTAVIAVLSIAIIAMVIAIVQSTVSAQPAIKTLPASPQGEWVVLNAFGGNGNPTPQAGWLSVTNPPDRLSRPRGEMAEYTVVVMCHTGTGKIRQVMWPRYKLITADEMVVTETP